MSIFLVILLLPLFIWVISIIFDRVLSGISSGLIRALTACATGILLAALATVAAGFQQAGQPASAFLTIAMFLFIIFIASAAIVTPLPLLDGMVSERERLMVLLACAVISLFFMMALLINPEIRAGGPEPLFADRLPLIGLILDSAVPGTGSGTLFSLLVNCGFYIEIAIVTTVVYFLVSWGRQRRKPREEDAS